MTTQEAISKLIRRNQSYVNKRGTDRYSRETDEIINALLVAYRRQEETRQTVESVRAASSSLGMPHLVVAAAKVPATFWERVAATDKNGFFGNDGHYYEWCRESIPDFIEQVSYAYDSVQEASQDILNEIRTYTEQRDQANDPTIIDMYNTLLGDCYQRLNDLI